jgi:hypothetical protein
MRLRRTAIAAVLAAGIVVPVLSNTAVAVAQPSAAAKSTAALKATKAAKPVKAVRFQASGVVTALDVTTGAVTLQTKTTVKSGKKTIKKTVITQVTVAATARVVVNDATATLASVGVGQRIVVTGTHSGTVYTATKVIATGTSVVPAPSPSATPTPTPSVEPTPSAEPTSETPTVVPSDESGTDL